MNKKLLLIGFAIGLILSIVISAWGRDYIVFAFGIVPDVTAKPFIEFGTVTPNATNLVVTIPGTFFSMKSIIFGLVGVLLVWLYLRFINR